MDRTIIASLASKLQARVDETVICLIDSNRGIYIPQNFAQRVQNGLFMVRASRWEGYESSDLFILSAGPEHEHYWDAWDNVLNTATMTESDGHTWSLHQDSDLFMVRDDCPEEWWA